VAELNDCDRVLKLLNPEFTTLIKPAKSINSEVKALIKPAKVLVSRSIALIKPAKCWSWQPQL
jgi:hypothetical protein